MRERRSHSDVKGKGRTIRRREEEVETQMVYRGGKVEEEEEEEKKRGERGEPGVGRHAHRGRF